MPIYDVTETRTITLTHRIRANNKYDAMDRMRYKDSSKGQVFLDIIEEDSDCEYECEEVKGKSNAETNND